MAGSILRVDCHTCAYTNVLKTDIPVPIHMFRRQTFFPSPFDLCHARIDIAPTLILNPMREVLPQSGKTWDQVPSQIYQTIPTILFLIINFFTFTIKCKRSGVVIGMVSGTALQVQISTEYVYTHFCEISLWKVIIHYFYPHYKIDSWRRITLNYNGLVVVLSTPSRK